MQGPKWPLFTLIWTLCGHWMCWDRLCIKGRAPRTKETLPDFRERCRVTDIYKCFRGLTGSQRTPKIWGVTAWYQSLGIRIPRELGFGYPSPLGVVRCRFRYEIT